LRALPWGAVEPDILRRIVVVSPHFDDAALGASHLLGTYSDTTVLTVNGGRPPAYPETPTDWDASGGFAPGDDVVAVRREEDLAALAELGSKAVWLEFPDHQYLDKKDRPTPHDVAPALEKSLKDLEPTSVFLPMGIANPDHVCAHDAGILARASMMRDGVIPSWFCYEDHGYKHLPGLLAWRVTTLFKSGLWPTPAVVPIEPDMRLKRAAIARYTSQLPPLREEHALDERLDANVPEQYWRLDVPPSGWEGLIDLV